tara:strand:- start:3357 stop:4061 length:705 start_codon:yes stop_codon:yes gene_type:complete
MFGTQTFTGTYDFQPTAGEIIMTAFGRIQIRPTEIEQSHLQSAVMELNLLLSRLSNTQPNLWSVDLQSLPLVQGQATYSLPAETVMITNAYVRTGTGTSTTDRLIFPLSQTEYASIANKLTQGQPTQFWFDRLISPTITFYLVPDGEGPYTVYYYRVRQVQDAKLPNGVNIEVPYLWLDALTAGLSYRLSRVYRPELEQIRKMDFDEAWQIAATQNTENVNLMISPGLSGYFRS